MTKPIVSILIIDDEPDFAQTLARRLELRGMAVHCEYSGEQGLARMRQSLPDLLLLDMRMPGLGGADVLRALRVQRVIPGGEALPVFIISGHSSERSFEEVNRLGIQGYFTKPLQFTELLREIERLE